MTAFRRVALPAGLIMWSMFAIPAPAQIAVSANDGKQLRPGEAPSTRVPDMIATIDMRRYPPKTLATIEVPASLVGPPTTVAVAHDGRLALVSAAQRLNAAGEIEPNGVLSVIDLRDPAAPRIVQTLETVPGPGGIAINRAGTLALVASPGDHSILAYAIAAGRLAPAGRLQLPDRTRPTDVTFAPDGRSALVTGQGSNRLIRLTVAGSALTVADARIMPGRQPWGVTFSRDGRYAYNSNLGGNLPAAGEPAPAPGTPRPGTVSATDLATGAVTSVEVGLTPEHVALSPDGRWLAVVVANGSALAETAPGYHPYGLLQVYRVDGVSLTRVAEAHSGGWCQGAVFSDDGRTLLLQCSLDKAIEVFRFDGKTLAQDMAATLRFPGRPGAMATASSR